MKQQNSSEQHLNRCVLGTAGLGGVWGKVDPNESMATILKSLECGIAAIDTAPAYGDAEQFVGRALKQWHGPKPIISSKVGRLKGFKADEGCYDYSAEGMQRSVEQTLETLGISALDILFLHDPSQIDKETIEQVLETMFSLKEKGYTKKIGLGGNPPEWMIPYLKPEIFDVLMEFNKLNACSTIALREHLPFCLAHNIQYYLASPLHMGLLGRCYESYINNPPVWLEGGFVEAAIRVKKLANTHGMALSTLAHRLLISFPYDFKIVIGASNSAELVSTIQDFKNGPLPEYLVNEIIHYANIK